MKRIFYLLFSCGLSSLPPLLIPPALSFAQNAPSIGAEKELPSIKSATQDQDESDTVTKKSETKNEKLETVVVKRELFLAYESFSGVFESTRSHEVNLDFESGTELIVKSAVAEGTAVSTGDRLLEFETEALDKAMAQAQFEVQHAKFELKIAELEMKQASETFELDQAMAERARNNAQEDYEYFLKTNLPQILDDLDYEQKSAGYYLEYAKDELDQLEQMYNADELTEESEAIVLKRAQRAVESAERSKKRSLTRVQREKTIEIPRKKISELESLKRQEMRFAKSQITVPITKRKAEIALEKAEFTLKNKQKLLDELKSDQAKMVVNSPTTGIVYYGDCERGKWTKSSGAKDLKPKSKLSANKVVMTIVDTGELRIRSEVNESSLGGLEPRLRGKALVTAARNLTVPVFIKSISMIPIESEKFDVQILVEKLPLEVALMPGMGCKLSFLVHQNEQALILPKESVFSDDDGVTHYVYVLRNEKPQRTAVTIGYEAGDNLEILDGVAEGDQVAKKKP